VFVRDKGTAIPQKFGFSPGHKINRLAFFWLFKNNVWLFIEMLIWQPWVGVKIVIGIPHAIGFRDVLSTAA